MNLNVFNKINYKPKSILDIGCNVGQFYNICRNFWKNSEIEYVLIDGNDNVEEDVKQLNVEHYITILSDSIKDVIWYKSKENLKCTGDSYYKENTKHYSNDNLIQLNKKTNTLNNLFQDRNFDLIKIDTQGSEIDIIKGGIDLCKKANFIILETSLIEYNLDAPMENDVVKFMNEIGFEVYEYIDAHYLNGKKSQNDILFKNKNNKI